MTLCLGLDANVTKAYKTRYSPLVTGISVVQLVTATSEPCDLYNEPDVHSHYLGHRAKQSHTRRKKLNT